ncbi:MAG: ABC transporter permease [Algiphilus sp.]
MSDRTPQEPALDPPALPPPTAGRSSVEVFRTSVWAFLLREMKDQFGRFRLGYFWALAEPGAVVAILTFLHAVVRGGHSTLYGESPVVFFVFGAVPYFLFMNCVQRAQGSISGMKGLFSYRQVRPIDVVIARSIIEGLTMVGVGFLFVLGWLWFGNTLPLADPLLLASSLTMLFLLGFSLGLCFEVFGTIYNDMRRIFAIVMRPMFFISGLFFTIEMIPMEYRPYLIWNPVLHAVDFTRDAVLQGYESPANPFYVPACILLLLFIGLSGYRRYMHQLI